MIKIGCWGTGEHAVKAIQLLKDMSNISVQFFIDSNIAKWGEVFYEYPIVNPEELKKRLTDIDLVLITTAAYWEEIFLQCIQMEIDYDKIKYWDCIDKTMYSMDRIYIQQVYSNNGEDRYLINKFFQKKKGFYVDVGSWHPFFYSNTYWAYKSGWSGINIEPNIENYQLFQKMRPRDININCGISETEGSMRYYEFNDSSLNTFSYDTAKYYENKGHQGYQDYQLKNTTDVKVRRLDNILKENGVNKIDFLDIDVEGMELSILKSIDFRVDIEYILLEQLDCRSLKDVINSEEGRFLNEKGYEAVSRYNNTTIYEKKLV